MKKALILGILACSISLWSGDVFFTSKILNVYDSFDEKSIYGRLLPTSKIEVMEEKNDMAKVKVVGFIKKDIANAVYFVPQRRILVAGFKKQNPFKFQTISTQGEWEKISAEIFVKKDDFQKDIKSLYKKANKLYKDNCSMCHPAPHIKDYTANQWPSTIKAMANRTALNKDQMFLVTEFLQKHAKDMKGEYHE